MIRGKPSDPGYVFPLAVSVPLVVTIDVAAWRRDYGAEATRESIAAAVRRGILEVAPQVAPDAVLEVRLSRR